MWLTYEELIDLTGYKLKKKQHEELNRMGIIHRVRHDGLSVVAYDHVRDIFGGLPKEEKKEQPDFEALYG